MYQFLQCMLRFTDQYEICPFIQVLLVMISRIRTGYNNGTTSFLCELAHFKSSFPHICEAHFSEVVEPIIVDNKETGAQHFNGRQYVFGCMGKHGIEYPYCEPILPH